MNYDFFSKQFNPKQTKKRFHIIISVQFISLIISEMKWNNFFEISKFSSLIWKLSCLKNSPDDFRAPDKDKLAHSPWAGSSRADTSPSDLLHTWSRAVGQASAQTTEPSSCVQYDPVNTSPHIKTYTLSSPASVHDTLTNVLPSSPGTPLLNSWSPCLHSCCAVWSQLMSSVCSWTTFQLH